jgi:Holliday junction resolvase
LLKQRNKQRGESEAHLILKREVLNMLREQGYTAVQEYWVTVGKQRFRVDVVGFKDEESIAIECGRTSYKKIQQLKLVFTKVERALYSWRIHPKARVPLNHKITQQLVRSHIVQGEVMGIAKMHGKGKIQVPYEIRYFLGLRTGDRVYFMEDEQGRVLVEKAPPLKSDQLGKYK